MEVIKESESLFVPDYLTSFTRRQDGMDVTGKDSKVLYFT
jgi:hypothetical protein